MPKPLITERAAAEPPARLLTPPSGKPPGKAEDIPERLRRSSPPPIPALDEATLRHHFADLATVAAPWRQGALSARAARLPGLAHLHPHQPAATVQGMLEVFHEVSRALAALTGLDRFSLQPSGLGAAQRAGLLVARASLELASPPRREVVAPAGSPALAHAVELGLEPRPVARLESGEIDLDALVGAAGPATVAVVATWLTPQGGFERNLAAAGDVAHAHGALFCVDATGLGALVGRTRLRDAGADVAWLSLGELCRAATGAALGVRSRLTEFLPSPLVGKTREGYELDSELPRSIGPLGFGLGAAGDAVALYIQLRALGAAGLRARAERLVLEASARSNGPRLSIQ